MYLGAHVLLPEGFDEHPDARYPLVIYHGHFPPAFGGFREEPPDSEPEAANTASASSSPATTASSRSTRTSSTRTGPARAFPRADHHRDPARQPVLRRLLRRELGEPRPLRRRHHLRADPVPREEVPRASAPAGRGSSTAARPAAGRRWPLQMFYPDEYNGAWVACPDPIDFRAYTVVNLYEDRNAYWREGPWHARRRGPGMRNYLGHVSTTLEEMNRLRAGARHARPLGPAVGHLGGGVLAGRARRLSRGASGTSAPA